MKRASSWLVAFSLASSALAAEKTMPAKPKLNVILISADAMRADMLGINDNHRVRTPHLDQLAGEGINFTRAYCAMTTTTPSHASMLSSLYPFDHRAYSNTSKVSSKIVTLPEILKEQGWHTAGIVNLPWLNPDVGNVPQGIDELARCKNILKADKTNRWVFRFLDSRRGNEKPFFLFIHYIDTHTPYHAPGEYARMYYPKDRNPRAGKSGTLQKAKKLFPKHHRNNPYIDKWLRGITDAEYIVASAKGSVSWLDHHIGQLIDRLKTNDQWKNTMLVFTSDHGESLGEHGLWFLHGGLFEPTARVPLIIRTPGGPAGKTVDRVVHHIDLLPTILARLGLEVPKQARGSDLFKTLKGETLSGGVALVEHAGGYIIAVVTPRYKYIKHRKTKKIYPSYPMKRGREELYDLQADPGESQNLAKKQAQVVKEMRALLKKLRSGKKVEYQQQKANIDEQTEEMLRSLGYTQ